MQLSFSTKILSLITPTINILNELLCLKMDSDVKAILKSHGYDVEHFRQKYTKKASSATPTLVKRTKGSSVHECDASKQRDIDEICICNSCQGLGIIKDTYNHIVREINCDTCETEGILWKQRSTGTLVPMSQRKEETG